MTATGDDEIYPGLVVNDHRVTGSIVVGPTRLPLWAIAPTAVTHGWDYVEEGWSPSDYGYGRHDLSRFLADLLEHRHEFARLILTLADVERSNRGRQNCKDWTTVKRQRKRLADQLRRCLAELDES